METANNTSKGLLWTSYILQGLVVVMFLMGAIQNLMGAEDALNMAKEYGYPEQATFRLGVILLVSTILYAIPKTNVLGMILLTAWLGGAVATHAIHQDPLTNHLFPVAFGVLIWLSVWLRDGNLKALFPFRK